MIAKFMTLSPDLTRFGRGTGALHNMRPVFPDFLPPCNHACPADGDIQGWLALAQEGRYEEAWQTLIENNPMLSIHGRVCYHPCEDACNRTYTDAAVSIHAVERFLGDLALEQSWKPRFEHRPDGKKVLVISADNHMAMAKELVKSLERELGTELVNLRWETYEHMAQQEPAEFQPVA